MVPERLTINTMVETKPFERPFFFDALAEWKRILAGHALPTDILWILDENLCFERDPASPTGLHLAYQTCFSPPPADVAERTYGFFSDFDARMVFYCLGKSAGRSVCMILCDPVFETRGPERGFIRRDEWLLSFYPGAGAELQEITDRDRWEDRVLRGRPLADVDFCMPHQLLRELDAHGRALEPQDRFGLKLLESWQQAG